jgi:hypothetical protein
MKIKLILIVVLLVLNFSAKSFSDIPLEDEGYQVDNITEEEQQRASVALKQWKKQTEELFKQLQRLDIDYSELEYSQQSSEKLSFGLVYSYDAKVGSKKGVPIAAVSPMSLMHNLGVRTGDIITSINKLSLKNQLENNSKGQWLTALILTEKLRSLSDGDAITFEIERNERTSSIQGLVESTKTPSFSLKVIAEDNDLSNCGTVSTYYRAKKRQQLYPVEIISIDGERIRNRSSLKLTEGLHKLEVKEQIQSSRLSNNIRNRYRVKSFEINVVRGIQYTIVSQFHLDLARDKENYWEPTFREKKKDCSL